MLDRIIRFSLTHRLFVLALGALITAFVKIHKSKHLYNLNLPVLPWVFTITRNTIYDSLRKSRHSEIPRPTERFDEQPALESRPDLVLDLQPVLQQLPPQQKLALELRYYDEKTFDEIATTLNSSPVNIRKMVSRGLHRLKEILKEGGT